MLDREFNPPINHSRYFIRQAILKGISEFIPNLKGKLLDFGCGSKPYQSLFEVEEYIGLDFKGEGHSHENENIDVYYDGKTIPLNNNSIDAIFSSEVLEHIFNPNEILQEFHRVLKPGGKVLITCPFVWSEHESPNDYARYTQFALKHLFESNGLKIISMKKNGNFAQAIAQIMLLYVLKPRSFVRIKFLNKSISLIFNLTGLLFSKILPKKWDFYLSNVVYAVKSNPNKKLTN